MSDAPTTDGLRKRLMPLVEEALDEARQQGMEEAWNAGYAKGWNAMHATRIPEGKVLVDRADLDLALGDAAAHNDYWSVWPWPEYLVRLRATLEGDGN